MHSTHAPHVKKTHHHHTHQRPPEPVIETEGVTALPVAPGVTLLRGVCNERLKYEIEYAKRRDTTENAYVLQRGGAGGPAVLIDVPFKAFQDDFGEFSSRARGGRQGEGSCAAAARRLIWRQTQCVGVFLCARTRFVSHATLTNTQKSQSPRSRP